MAVILWTKRVYKCKHQTWLRLVGFICCLSVTACKNKNIENKPSQLWTMNKKWPLSWFTPHQSLIRFSLSWKQSAVFLPLKLFFTSSSRIQSIFFCSLSRLLYELQQILVDKIFMLEVEIHLATFFDIRRCNLKWINVQLQCSISYLQCINFACYVISFLFINKIQFHVPILKTSTTERCTLARLWMYHLGDGTSTTSQKYIFLMSVKLPIFMHLLFLPLISYA